MGRLVRIAALTFAAAALSQAASAQATVSASATISSQPVSGGFKYSLALTNSASSNESISTLWFGWYPGYDYLSSPTTSFTGPAGWTGVDAPDTFTFFGSHSAQWTTTTASLAPGQTDNFSFITAEAPTSILGVPSGFVGNRDETFVYTGAPEVGNSAAFEPTAAVPEPVSFALLTPAALLMLRRRRS